MRRNSDTVFTKRVQMLAPEYGLSLLAGGAYSDVYSGAIRFPFPLTVRDRAYAQALDIGTDG